MITHKQLTLAEIFDDCQNKFDNDKYQFLSLLGETINLDEIVPVSFVSHFHASTGRPRKHQLYPMLKALLLQRIFSIPTINDNLNMYINDHLRIHTSDYTFRSTQLDFKYDSFY